MTVYIPTLLLIVISYATNFFKPFFFEAIVGVNLTSMLVRTFEDFFHFVQIKILGLGNYVFVCGRQSTKNFLHQDGWCLVSCNLGISFPWGTSLEENWRYMQIIVLGSTAYSHWSLQGWWWKQRRIS